MCHEWQQHFGHPPARHYHNMEWAEKMISVGLMPSNTGQFGGKITGSRMADYIIEDGPFARTAAEFVEAEGEVPYVDLTTAQGGRPDRSKTKFTCPQCGQALWGAPSSEVICDRPSCAGDRIRLLPPAG